MVPARTRAAAIDSCFRISLLPGFLLVSLSQPGAAQNIAQRVVGLVARVLEDVLAGGRPGVFAGPWLCPRCRIVDREAVEERIGSDARESLDHLPVLARSSESGLIGEIGRVDDQRIPFPA